MVDDEYSTVRLRIRDAWNRYAVVMILLGLVLGAAGGFAVANSLAVGPLPGEGQLQESTETEERTVRIMEASGTFDHGATVRRDSSAFRRGERLSDRALYFRSVAPILDGTHRFAYSAADGDLRVQTDARLIIREVDEEARYWSVTEPVGSTRTEGVEPGESVETEFNVNVSAIDRRADAIREELGASPGSVESVVVVRTTFEGTADGQQVSGTMTSQLRIDSDGDVYRVAGTKGTAVEERTETVVVDRETSILQALGGVALLGLGIAVIWLTFVGKYRSRFALSPAEEHALERAEYGEWITTARVPTDATDRPVVPISSLQGLVDLAIDTDGRVIHDEVSGHYVLFDDTFTYIFIPQYVAANTIGVTTDESPEGPASAPDEVKHPRSKPSGEGDGAAEDPGGESGTGRVARQPADSAQAGDDEAPFGGWIITEPLAEDIGGDRTVSVSSLPKLVGLAVDADRPVIKDKTSETYVLFGDEATYAFVPDEGTGPGSNDGDPGEQPPDGADVTDTGHGSDETAGQRPVDEGPDG